MRTHNIPFFISKKKKTTLYYPKSAPVPMGFFQGGKQAISVRATEALLYLAGT